MMSSQASQYAASEHALRAELGLECDKRCAEEVQKAVAEALLKSEQDGMLGKNDVHLAHEAEMTKMQSQLEALSGNDSDDAAKIELLTKLLEQTKIDADEAVKLAHLKTKEDLTADFLGQLETTKRGNNDVVAALRQEIEDLKDSIGKYNADHLKEMDDVKRQNLMLEAEKQTLKANFGSEVCNLEEVISAMTPKLQNISAELKDLKGIKVPSLEDENKVLSKELEALKATNNLLRDEVANAADTNMLAADLEDLRAANDKLQSALSIERMLGLSVKDDAKAASQNLDTCLAVCAELNQNITSLEKDLETARAEAAAQKAAGDAQAEAARLKAENDEKLRLERLAGEKTGSNFSGNVTTGWIQTHDLAPKYDIKVDAVWPYDPQFSDDEALWAKHNEWQVMYREKYSSESTASCSPKGASSANGK